MKVLPFPPENESRSPLDKAKPGTVVRMPEVPYGDAIAEGAFYVVLEAPELKAGRVRIACLKDGKVLERDGDREVVVHETEMRVKPAV